MLPTRVPPPVAAVAATMLVLLSALPCTLGQDNADAWQRVAVGPGGVWTSCGWYGLRYQTSCNSTNNLVYIGSAQDCNTTLLVVCPSLSKYSSLTCSSSNYCDKTVEGPNTVSLCMVLTSIEAINTMKCDIKITGVRAVIEPAEGTGLAWPNWQIIAVAVGAGVPVLILLAGGILALWWCCCRQTSPTHPDDPYEIRPNKIPQVPGAIPYLPFNHGMPQQQMTPAYYGPQYTTQIGPASIAAGGRDAAHMYPHTAVYPPNYYLPQQPGQR